MSYILFGRRCCRPATPGTAVAQGIPGPAAAERGYAQSPPLHRPQVASLLHLVPKKDSSWCPCGDYRCLNAVTVPGRYPLPNMQSLNDPTSGCNVFSKIDLVKAYHQIPIAKADVLITAIAMPLGLFEFLFTC